MPWEFTYNWYNLSFKIFLKNLITEKFDVFIVYLYPKNFCIYVCVLCMCTKYNTHTHYTSFFSIELTGSSYLCVWFLWRWDSYRKESELEDTGLELCETLNSCGRPRTVQHGTCQQLCLQSKYHSF